MRGWYPVYLSNMHTPSLTRSLPLSHSFAHALCLRMLRAPLSPVTRAQMYSRNALVYQGMSATNIVVSGASTLLGGLRSANDITVQQGGLTVSTGGATIIGG